MNNRWIYTLGGLLLGFLQPLVTGALVASANSVKAKNFFWTLYHMNGFYNSFFQLGIAVNIGIFFLLMKKETLPATLFMRGWLVSTLLMAVWAISIELHWSL